MDQDVTLSTHITTTLTPMMDDRVGDVIAELLIQRIGQDRFEMWFAAENCIREENKAGNGDPVIVIAADNHFALNRIKTTFGSELRTLVDQVCGPQKEIAYKLTRSKPKNSTVGKTASLKKADKTGRSCFQIELPLGDADSEREVDLLHYDTDANGQTWGTEVSQCSQQPIKARKRNRGLKSFWFGTESRLAEASVSQILEQPGQFSPFFVYGATGCGKSYLLEAILHEFRHRLRLKRCVMLSAEQFTSLFVSSLRGGEGLPVFRRKYRDLDLLIIDDIQFLAGKKATICEFYHTVDILVRSGKQVIVSADRPAVELGLLGGDFGNRLNAGLSCPLYYPGVAGRIEIAKRLCTERNIQLSSSLIEFICERLPGDVRRISGALNRLHAYRLAVGHPITIELAENELGDLFSAHRNHGVSLMRIESAVCELCGIKPIELKSNSRRKSISSARMLAMYLSRQYTSSAFSEIGDYYGGRSHSTVIAAQKKVTHWIEGNEGVTLPNATYRAKEVISRLESNLRIG